MSTPPIPLIMTRPAEANARFVGDLPTSLRQRFQVIDTPLIRIVAVDPAPAIAPEDAVVFTSANGVRFAPPGQGRAAYCVGQRTTAAARLAGWQAIFAGETSDKLVASLSVERRLPHLWHLAGRHTRGRIAERLSAEGRDVTRVTLYDQVLQPLTDQARAVLIGEMPVIVPLFSPRTAAWFAEVCPPAARPHIIALSADVATPLADSTLSSLEIAARPDAAALVDCLEKRVGRISLG